MVVLGVSEWLGGSWGVYSGVVDITCAHYSLMALTSDKVVRFFQPKCKKACETAGVSHGFQITSLTGCQLLQLIEIYLHRQRPCSGLFATGNVFSLTGINSIHLLVQYACLLLSSNPLLGVPGPSCKILYHDTLPCSCTSVSKRQSDDRYRFQQP